MIDASSSWIDGKGSAVLLVLILAVAGGEGCGSSTRLSNTDDSFFVPLTSVEKQAASKPMQSPERTTTATTGSRADSLLGRQREQGQRIGELSTQIQRLEASRTNVAANSSREAYDKSSPVRPDTQLVANRYEDILRLYQSGRYKAAAEGFRALIVPGLSPDVEDQYNVLLGQCYFKLRQYDLASVALKKVVSRKNSKRKGDALLILGQSYQQLGFSKQAKSMFEAVLKESPGSELETAARTHLKELASKK